MCNELPALIITIIITTMKYQMMLRHVGKLLYRQRSQEWQRFIISLNFCHCLHTWICSMLLTVNKLLTAQKSTVNRRTFKWTADIQETVPSRKKSMTLSNSAIAPSMQELKVEAESNYMYIYCALFWNFQANEYSIDTSCSIHNYCWVLLQSKKWHKPDYATAFQTSTCLPNVYSNWRTKSTM